MTEQTTKRGLPAPPYLMLITESSPNKEAIVTSAIQGGVNLVRLRDEELAFLAEHPDRTRESVGGTVKVAVDGVALPNEESGIHVTENGSIAAHKLKGIFSFPFVGRSIHSIEKALWAEEDKADYLLAGTIYPSKSHPGEPGQGIDFLREVCEAVAPLPVIAIGGIYLERVGECIAAGAAGVAILSPIMRAENPSAVARQYREELDKAWNLRSMAKL